MLGAKAKPRCRRMITFTLDTNCIIDLAEKRPAARHISALAKAHATRNADVALVAVSASERQRNDIYLSSYTDFERRVTDLGLAHLLILQPIAYSDIGFWGRGLWADEVMVDRERAIHNALFPHIPFSWPDFADSVGVSPDTINIPEAKRWRNAFCDRQMYWAHDHQSRDVFVTSDENFRNLIGLADFPNARVLPPDKAAKLL